MDVSERFTFGDGRAVRRLGYGSMQLTGDRAWGPPRDPDEARRVLRRCLDLGVEFIDTADVYGPFVTDQLIREALAPYPAQLLIASKVGSSAQGPGRYTPIGRPEYLRQQAELTLRHLGLECLELLQLHRIDPTVPFADQVGELALLRDEGKVRHIGLSEVSVEELDEARGIVPIASVQNRFNLVDRGSEDVLEECERAGIAFIPWFPLAGRGLAQDSGPVSAIAARHGCTPGQLSLAWLLHRSPVIIPIPGTSSVAHLEENMGARDVRLSAAEVAELHGMGVMDSAAT